MKYKKGDLVKVLRKPTDEELSEWDNSWMPGMDDSIGKELTVLQDSYKIEQGVELDDGMASYDYPEHILKKVKKNKIKKS